MSTTVTPSLSGGLNFPYHLWANASYTAGYQHSVNSNFADTESVDSGVDQSCSIVQLFDEQEEVDETSQKTNSVYSAYSSYFGTSINDLTRFDGAHGSAGFDHLADGEIRCQSPDLEPIQPPCDPMEMRKQIRQKMHRCKTCKNRFVEKDIYERHLRDLHPDKYESYMEEQAKMMEEQRMAELEQMRREEIKSGGFILPAREVEQAEALADPNEIKLPEEDDYGHFYVRDEYGMPKFKKKAYRKKVSPQCPFCDKRFRNDNSLKKHVAKKHPECISFVQCNKCFKCVASRELLINHACELIYVCWECAPIRNMITEERLESHRKKFHRGAYSGFKCPDCNRKFLTPRKLRKHRKMTHIVRKPYKCHFCDEYFPTDTQAALHERIHTGKIKFECNICDFRTNRFLRLHDHRRKEHGYICVICSEKTVEYAELKYHTLEKHNGYLSSESQAAYKSLMNQPIVTSSDIVNQNSYSTSKEHIDEVIIAVLSSTTNQVPPARPPAAAPTTTTTTSFGTPRSTANSYSDFPENLLENSSTPPLESIQRDNIAGTFLKVDSSSFNKFSALNINGQLRPPTTTVVSAAPVFASLAPVSIDVNFLPSTDVFSILPSTNTNNVNIAAVGGHNSSSLLSINSLNGSTLKEPTLINVSSTQTATESPTKPVPGIRHLFSALPAVSLGGGIAIQNPLNRTASQIVGHNGAANNATLVTGIPANYLAVKIEHSQQNSDILFTNNGGSSHANLSLIGANTTLLSPAQLTLGSTATCGSSNLSALSSSPGDFLSLAPSTTVYVQPVNQNGHLQFIKLNFTTSPSSVICSEPTFASSTSLSNLHKLPSSVNTVQLASNLIASMLQEQEEDRCLKGGGNSLDHIVTNCENAYLSVANEVSINENRAPDQVLPLDSILSDQVSLTTEKMLDYDRQNDRNSSDFNLMDQRQQCVASTSRKSFRAQTSMYNNTMSIDEQNSLISSSAKPKVSSSDHHDFTTLKAKQKEISIAMANLAAAGEDDTDDIFIDTKDLCNRIAYELKAHSIPQAVFAERVLCRSQGTLSDLLRNPKPWNKLKSGRETFRRMYYWLKLPVDQRLAILEIIDDEDTNAAASISDVAAASASASSATKVGPISVERLLSSSSSSVIGGGVPTSAVAASTADHFKYGGNKRRKSASSCLKTTSGDDDDTETDEEENRARAAGHRRRKTTDETGRGGKRPRLVFTDIQKRTLQAIFKETQRPSREMQQTIAEHLGLDLSTVQNFFMNARRRTRFDQTNSDSSLSTPYPYQQVRTITPPPVSRSPTPGDRDVVDQPDDGDDLSASDNMPRPVQLFRQAVAAVASPEAAAALIGLSATSLRKNQRTQQKSRGSKRNDNAATSASPSSKARSSAPNLPRGLSVKAAPVSSDQWKIIQLKFDPGAPAQGIGVRVASASADRSPPSTSDNPKQAVGVCAPPNLTDETLSTTTTTNDDQNSAPITCDLSQL